MDKITKLTWLSIATLVIVVLIGVKSYSQATDSLGSVTQGNEYKTKNITTLTGSTTVATSIKGSAGVLGSVVISSTTAQGITLYDVASGANYASTTLSTKLITLATSTPAGTYTFDVNYSKGLAVYAPITPTTEVVITYR